MLTLSSTYFVWIKQLKNMFGFALQFWGGPHWTIVYFSVCVHAQDQVLALTVNIQWPGSWTAPIIRSCWVGSHYKRPGAFTESLTWHHQSWTLFTELTSTLPTFNLDPFPSQILVISNESMNRAFPPTLFFSATILDISALITWSVSTGLGNNCKSCDVWIM